MKSFQNCCAQGDVMIIRRDALPKGLKPVAAENGRVVVTHSETGHHHEMALDKPKGKAKPAVVMYSTDNPLIAWLEVNRPTALEHLRPHDTHEPIMVAPASMKSVASGNTCRTGSVRCRTEAAFPDVEIAGIRA